jgi:hypothetical protein
MMKKKRFITSATARHHQRSHRAGLERQTEAERHHRRLQRDADGDDDDAGTRLGKLIFYIADEAAK